MSKHKNEYTNKYSLEYLVKMAIGLGATLYSHYKDMHYFYSDKHEQKLTYIARYCVLWYNPKMSFYDEEEIKVNSGLVAITKGERVIPIQKLIDKLGTQTHE